MIAKARFNRKQSTVNRARRAQIINHAFVLILASVVVILIVFYGYKAIKQMNEKADLARVIMFETKLKEEAETIAGEPKGVSKVDLSLPSRFKTLCMVDERIKTDSRFNARNDELTQMHPSMAELCCGSQNVFLDPPSSIKIKVDNSIIPNGYFCMNITGKFALRMEGTGRKTCITPWGEETECTPTSPTTRPTPAVPKPTPAAPTPTPAPTTPSAPKPTPSLVVAVPEECTPPNINPSDPFDFALQVSPITVWRGWSSTVHALATLVSGTPMPVTFSVPRPHPGTTVTFTPQSCTPPCKVDYTVSADETTPLGTFDVEVVGTSVSITHVASTLKGPTKCDPTFGSISMTRIRRSD
ncbi:hypothetical protein HY642_05820 [Candidatus Woesearchaeota archaeon]|nr:hypothetical protein [Candidatus Woesearchaeota archaeon]